MNDTIKLLQSILYTSQRIYNINIQQLYNQRAQSHPNPFVTFGSKVFSQSDEDGLTFEIIRRIGINKGTFVEFGIGNGTENNTLALAALGWRGEWFGGETLAYQMPIDSKVTFSNVWISRENILTLIGEAVERLSVEIPNLISIDLDGNDLFLIELMLSNGYRPEVWICEYNSKFIPPIEFSIDYSETHKWKSSDYFGASLTSINNLMVAHNYKAVCCNAATGANVFFVQEPYFHLFPEVPDDLLKIYTTPNYNLLNYYGHNTSEETLISCLKQ